MNFVAETHVFYLPEKDDTYVIRLDYVAAGLVVVIVLVIWWLARKRKR